jgi:hypothetical protein
MGFKLLYDAYDVAYSHEVLALDLILKSEYTVQIHAQDRERDRLFRGFAETVKGATHHYDPTVATAAHLLLDIFNHYGNIAQRTLDDETAALNDLLRELEAPAAAAAMTAAGVGAWHTQLAAANAAFAALMTDRYVEAATRTPYRMVPTRRETDKYYHAIVNQLENQLLAGVHTADELVAELNAVLERYKRILAQEIGERRPPVPPPPPNTPAPDDAQRDAHEA